MSTSERMPTMRFLECPHTVALARFKNPVHGVNVCIRWHINCDPTPTRDLA